jgi:hypothetical protein
MPDNREELENRLIEQAKQAIKNMLDEKNGRRDLSMTEMEDLVGDLETDFRQAVLQELVDESQEQAKGLCPSCQGKLRNKGKRRKRLITVRGEIEVERDYYVCLNCGAGFSPSG